MEDLIHDAVFGTESEPQDWGQASAGAGYCKFDDDRVESIVCHDTDVRTRTTNLQVHEIFELHESCPIDLLDGYKCECPCHGVSS